MLDVAKQTFDMAEVISPIAEFSLNCLFLALSKSKNKRQYLNACKLISHAAKKASKNFESQIANQNRKRKCKMRKGRQEPTNN